MVMTTPEVNVLSTLPGPIVMPVVSEVERMTETEGCATAGDVPPATELAGATDVAAGTTLLSGVDDC